MCPLKALKKPAKSDFSISMSETSWNFDIPTHIKRKRFYAFEQILTKICILKFHFLSTVSVLTAQYDYTILYLQHIMKL